MAGKKKSTSDKRKDYMKSAYARGKSRAAGRAARQAAQAAENRQRRVRGEPTPWQEAKALRRKLRDGGRIPVNGGSGGQS